MTEILFESPLKLGACFMLPVLAVLWVWYVRRTAASHRVVIVVLVVVAVTFAVQRMVVTQRESLIVVCLELAELTEAGNIDGISRYLDSDFEAAGYDKSEMLERIEHVLKRYHPEESRLKNFKMIGLGSDESNSNISATEQVQMTFDVTCRIASRDVNHFNIPSRWRLTFVPHGHQWRVTNIESLPMPMSPVGQLSDLMNP